MRDIINNSKTVCFHHSYLQLYNDIRWTVRTLIVMGGWILLKSIVSGYPVSAAVPCSAFTVLVAVGGAAFVLHLVWIGLFDQLFQIQ